MEELNSFHTNNYILTIPLYYQLPSPYYNATIPNVPIQ